MTRLPIRLALGCSVALLGVAVSWAWSEPETVKGVPWGASVDEARGIFRMAGAPPAEAFCYGMTCVWDTTLGAVPVRLVLEFPNRRFARGVVQFKAGNYAAVRQHFIDTYGEPTDRRAPPGPGGTERLTWSGNRVAIELRAAADAEGRATITLKDIGDQRPDGTPRPGLR